MLEVAVAVSGARGARGVRGASFEEERGGSSLADNEEALPRGASGASAPRPPILRLMQVRECKANRNEKQAKQL